MVARAVLFACACGVGATTWAQQEVCAAALTPSEFAADLDRIDGRILYADRAAAAAEWEALHHEARCLDAILRPADVTRFAVQGARLAFWSQDEETAERWAGLARVTSEVVWPPRAGEQEVFRRSFERHAIPESTAIEGRLDPDDGEHLFADGRFLASPDTFIAVPHLMQLTDKKGVVIRTWWQDGVAFPDDIVSPGEGAAVPPGWWTPPPSPPDPAGLAVDTCDYAPETLSSDRRAALDAIENDDPASFLAVHERVKRGVECLQTIVPFADWAGYLVALSIYRYSVNDDWQAPMTSALRAVPQVDRNVGEKHPIYGWQPGAEPPGATQVPAGVEAYVDGRKVSFLPMSGGPSLVQVYVDGVLHTRWFDGPPDAAWVGELAPAASTTPASIGVQAATGHTASPAQRNIGIGLGIGGGAVALTGVGLAISAYAEAGSVSGDTSLGVVTRERVGWALAGTGAAIAIAGVITVAVAPRSKVTVGISPSGVSVAGRF